MQQRLKFGAVIVACALVAGGCDGGRSGGVAAAAGPAASSAPAAPPDVPAGMAHGDHNPHHGGVVYMYDDMHYEVVLDSGGHHRVYFTDSARDDLPAAVASSVTLTVERPGAAAEGLNGVIDPQGESWIVDGQPVTDKDTSVRVAFVIKGSQYWIDVPFIPTQ